jgi:hypothetical protein
VQLIASRGLTLRAFDWFDRVYCIHLPVPARRKEMESQFAAVGIKDVQYIHAKEPVGGLSMSNMRRNPQAELGVNLSHVKAVVRAIADGAKRPLFVEDDIEFSSYIEECLPVSLSELPEDWDVLYMGGHPRSPAVRYKSMLVKVGTFSFAESYSINGRSLRKFFDFWCDRVGQPHAMYDFVLGEFAAANNGFCTHPLMTEQGINFSHVGQKVDTGKQQLVERGWRNNLSTK